MFGIREHRTVRGPFVALIARMRTPNRTRVSTNWDLGFWNGVESYPIGDTGIQPIGIVLSSQ